MRVCLTLKLSVILVVLWAAVGAAPASAVANPTACGEVVVTDVRLEQDLLCSDVDGLIVGADAITIDLNGHRIDCIALGDGYGASCQGAGPNGVVLEDPDPEVGVDTNGHSHVTVTSSPNGGALFGFDVGVRIPGGSDVFVDRLLLNGGGSLPSGAPNLRPDTVGILVSSTVCHTPAQYVVHLGAGGTTNTNGNQVQSFNVGIALRDADCVNVGWNHVDTSASELLESHGILVLDSAHGVVQGNTVFSNGDLGDLDGGLTLAGPATTDETVTENEVTDNLADGISAREGATGNVIANNVSLRNGAALAGTVFYDAADGPQRANDPLPTNFWNDNNVCMTQTAPNPPPGVCGP